MASDKLTNSCAVKPKLSIGLPVYNGERFLSQALNSLLSQTFTDFELIVSDNASTDTTWAICQQFAAADPRVICRRNAKNLGAAPNFNQLVSLTRGEYFKWAAHDDVCAPGYLEACVEFLDQHPETVLCHTLSLAIDESGETKGIYPHDRDFSAPIPHVRLGRLISAPHICAIIFGVIRTETIRRTPLLQPYVGSDRNLLAELALYGDIQVLEKPLFFRRDHPQTSVRRFTDNESGWISWFDTSCPNRSAHPTLTMVREYGRAIYYAPLPEEEKKRCREAVEIWVQQGRDFKGRPVAAILRQEMTVGRP